MVCSFYAVIIIIIGITYTPNSGNHTTVILSDISPYIL